MSNHNSPEYKAIIQCSPDLTIAIKDDLTSLSGELLAAGLIAENNAASLQIQFIGPAERAAQLVGYVLNRVSLNTDNYHSFVGVLEKRKDVHKDILKTLDKKFKELGGRYPLSKPSESYKDGHAADCKRSGAGDLSPSLKRSMESDVFQKFYAELNSSITDPDQFAAELIQHKFTTKQTADNKMPLGVSNYRKIGNLLGIVDSHIRSVSSVTPERVKERFVTLVLILRNKLGLDGLPQKMEMECYGTQQEHAIADEAQNGSYAFHDKQKR